MTDTPTDDKPGLIAEETEYCHCADRRRTSVRRPGAQKGWPPWIIRADLLSPERAASFGEDRIMPRALCVLKWWHHFASRTKA
jgi:hypothetical protein